MNLAPEIRVKKIMVWGLLFIHRLGLRIYLWNEQTTAHTKTTSPLGIEVGVMMWCHCHYLRSRIKLRSLIYEDNFNNTLCIL